MSDPLGISLPVVLLLLAWWKRGVINKSRRWRLAPFFVIGLIGVGVNVFLHVSSSDSLGPAPSLTALQRMSIAGRGIGFHAINLLRLYPAEMIHPRWNAAWGAWNVVPALLVLALGLIFWAGRRWWASVPLLCLAVFVALLLPGIITTLAPAAPPIYVADYQQYLAAAVPLALIATGLMGVADWLSSWMTIRAARVVVGSVAVGLLATFAVLQSLSYRDADTGFLAALSHNPRNNLARAQYALLLLDEEPSKATQILNDAGADAASDLSIVDARARVDLALGRTDDAVSSYLLAARVAPDSASVRLGLAAAYDAAGVAAGSAGRRDDEFENFNSALAVYDAAQQLNPNDAKVFDGIGTVMLHEGRLDKSIDQFNAALKLDPDFAAARVHQAQALFESGIKGDVEKLKSGLLAINEVLRDDPTNAEAFCAAADMQYRIKNFAAAEIAYRAAIQYRPGSARTWTDLGFSQSAQSRFPEALRSFERALSLQADDSDALRGKRLAQAQLAPGNHKS
jgi:tetratricopeptide (TPR) repeat protein